MRPLGSTDRMGSMRPTGSRRSGGPRRPGRPRGRRRGAGELATEQHDLLRSIDEHVARWERLVAATTRLLDEALADPTLVARPRGPIGRRVDRARARRLAALPPPPPRRTHTGRVECDAFAHDWIHEVITGDWGGLTRRSRCRRCDLTYYS